MNKQEEINSLKAKIKKLESEIANCRHDWKEAKYDPEIVREPYGYRMVGQGSDVWSEPEGYKEVEKKRWSRECMLCGHKEYTYQQEPVHTSYKPKF